MREIRGDIRSTRILMRLPGWLTPHTPFRLFGLCLLAQTRRRRTIQISSILFQMADPVALQVEIDLGAETYAEELDAHTRRIQSDLRACGIDAKLSAADSPPHTKGGSAPQAGRLGVATPPEQLAGLVAVLMQWAGGDPARTAAIRNVPPEQLSALATLVLAALARAPGRLATFAYRDGERHIQMEYDPTITDPRSLLVEIRGAISSTVTITAQGDITIGGSVAGRDQAAVSNSP